MVQISAMGAERNMIKTIMVLGQDFGKCQEDQITTYFSFSLKHEPQPKTETLANLSRLDLSSRSLSLSLSLSLLRYKNKQASRNTFVQAE